MHVCVYVPGCQGIFFQSQGIVSEKKKTFKEEILRGFGGQHPQQGGFGDRFPIIEKNFNIGLNLNINKDLRVFLGLCILLLYLRLRH